MTNILHQEYKKILDKQGSISTEDLKPLEEILDKNPELIDSKDTKGATLLHNCAISCSTPWRKRLLENLITRQANPFVEDNDGFTPKMEAARCGNSTAYQLLSAYEDKVRTKELAKALSALSVLVSLLHTTSTVDMKKKIEANIFLENVAAKLMGSRQMGD